MPSISKPLAAGLLAAYFLYLVLVAAPASLVAWGAMKAVPDLKLSGVTGTIWNGRAAGASLQLGATPYALGSLSWQLSPLNLLLFKACVQLKSDKLAGNFCHGVTGSSALKGVQVELPASLANSLAAGSGAAIDGTLSVLVDQASFTKSLQVSALKGNLNWRGAKVSINGMAFALGDYGADLSPDGQGGLKAQVVDLSGPIKVNLEASVKLGQSPRVVGDINPSDQAPAAIRDALGLVATPGDNGAFHVTYPLGS